MRRKVVCEINFYSRVIGKCSGEIVTGMKESRNVHGDIYVFAKTIDKENSSLYLFMVLYLH